MSGRCPACTGGSSGERGGGAASPLMRSICLTEAAEFTLADTGRVKSADLRYFSSPRRKAEISFSAMCVSGTFSPEK
jgi:hypothetical protein